ncbi:hypothetical protein [Flexithrix dorotheae]|uniref:hypothetical protein n=1 Tax=Flexithrix dorotheae TaxID=70993 RepID=UPI0003AA0647|nr:hypothetical protein [Flexithrix dorotheae]
MEAQNHEHKDGHKDNNNSSLPCSPFYSCGNCSGFFLKDQRLCDFSLLSQPKIPKSEYYLDYVSEGYGIIPLKPPRYI